MAPIASNRKAGEAHLSGLKTLLQLLEDCSCAGRHSGEGRRDRLCKSSGIGLPAKVLPDRVLGLAATQPIKQGKDYLPITDAAVGRQCNSIDLVSNLQ
ncbi:hypothetical protein ABIA14_005021 [Sinorhizobium fredii]